MAKKLALALALALMGCQAQEGPEIASTTSALSSAKRDPKLVKSTTGPKPPKALTDRDAKRRATSAAAPRAAAAAAAAETVIAGVPAYLWRHGCAPTAAGMVVGYYDAHGYSLIDGDASAQTAAVDQAIASGGTWGAPFPAGSERHFEDYATPNDNGEATPFPDAYLTANRAPHADNSIADYMFTSRSDFLLNYGWSQDWFVGPGLIGYVQQKAPSVTVETATAFFWDNTLTWQLVTQEIDNNRPMVFAVDSDANGLADHAVTVIGYRETPTRQYACLDTWTTTPRWEDFVPVASGQWFGVESVHTFRFSGGAQCSTNAQCDDGLACSVDTCVTGACEHDTSTCGCTSNAQCDDGKFCNGQETCVAGVCVAGTSWGAACEQATLLLRNQASGNFNTSGEKWFYTTESINGWWSSNMDGRTIRVNGQIVQPNALPLPDMINSVRYFQFTAGSYPWASWGFW